jgi:hypothetical protein
MSIIYYNSHYIEKHNKNINKIKLDVLFQQRRNSMLNNNKLRNLNQYNIICIYIKIILLITSSNVVTTNLFSIKET